MKQSRASLWWIWLYGSFLIVISLYATRKLPPSVQEVINRRSASSIGPTQQPDPTITIFSAITHYPIGQRQRLAVRSWLGLSNQISVVLFTQEHHPSVVDFASGFGSRVSVDSAVDFTFLGTPFFHSMVERSKAFQTDVTVFVHPQAVLFPDLVHTLNFAHKLDGYWLLVASLEETNFFTENGEKLQLNELQEMIHGWNRSNRCEDRSMITAWNGGNMPLHNGVLPPFLFGKGIHNHWLVNEAIASEFRLVFDASSTISGAFLNEPDMAENRSWEAIGNSLLGSSYGSLLFHEANYSTTVLAKLDDQYLFLEDAKPSKGMSSCSVKNELRNLQQPLEFRASIESLLSLAADETRTVVLAVAGYSYKDMLMSWVCRLRRLKVTNFVICALDHETFEFSVLQGLPVFYDPSAPRNISFDDCHFGTKCFQRVTKVKSRLVLKILKLGYNVLLSDVDVYWFRNPLQLLHSFGPGFLVGQSDEYNKTGPINLPRRLNSGFYFALSDPPTITAIEKVVIHAATSGLSEQPSFYDVLCGEGGSNRVGDNRCLDPETNLTVHFLDRNLFPNGAYLDLWDEPNVTEACVKMDCFVLHNNWINGRMKKLERQVSSGLWEYDSSKRIRGKSRRKRELTRASVSLDYSKDTSVRIVHPGGRQELYESALPAREIMEKYPGTRVAEPGVFKNPEDSLLHGEEKLMPDNKYLVIPSTTVEKLRHRHSRTGKSRKANGDDSDDTLNVSNITWDERDTSEESAWSAKDFYATMRSERKNVRSRHKPFVPPLPMVRSFKGLSWEPNLTSVQELSP